MDIFKKDTQEFLIKSGRPVLLIGKHGVGKTSVLRSISENFGLVSHELNAGTLDPFVHIVGIPVTHDGKVTMSPPEELQKAEILFIDEINRSDRQTRNALFEIICDNSINGKKLPNLKLVVAAMNPPDGEYQVDDLDVAMDDRFLYRFKVDPDITYALNKLSDEKQKAAFKKWYNALQEPPSPRRLTWVIETAIDEDGKFNQEAVLNALDDNLYGTKALLAMLSSNKTTEEILSNDHLYDEDEKAVISNIIYSALSGAEENGAVITNQILDEIHEQFTSGDGKTFLPVPTGSLTENQKRAMSSSEQVKKINAMFDFGFSLAEYKHNVTDETWLGSYIDLTPVAVP